MRALRSVALLGSLVTIGAGVLALPATPASAQTVTKTYPGVQCQANVNGSNISQSQDVTVEITAPDHVNPGQSFTITFPGGTSELPSKSSGFTITSYKDLSLSYQIHNTTFDDGTINNPGTATINGNPTPETATINPSDTFILGNPGPFPPGELITPDVSVGATAGAAGTSITINALKLTTTAVLNGGLTAKVVCNIPQDTVITIPVVAPVPPPTVDAGPDVSGHTGSPIPLHGVVTDSSSTPTDSWTIDSSSCSFTNSAAPSTAVTCSQPGTFTATLSADDGVNAPVTDTATVTVTQVVPLVVNAGGDVTGVVQHAIALHGTVSDPGNTPTSQWTADSPSCSFGNANAASTTVTCTSTGTFHATLTANDGVNPPVSDTAAITVTVEHPPVVSAGPDVSGNTGLPIAITGTATDQDNDPLTSHWTVNDAACSFGDPTKLSTTITCTSERNVVATLTVTDGYTAPVTSTANVSVTDQRVPFNWNVDATTHLQKLNQDVTIPTGTFVGVVDLTTGQITGDITLPPAQTTLTLAGIGLVTANMQIVETQPITGTLDPSTFAVTATAVFNINIPSVYPAATPTVNIVGNSCTTTSPVSVTMSGTAHLNGLSNFSGTYTIPNLKTCGVATTALNLVIPGPGNTFNAAVQPPPAPPTISSQPADTTTTVGGSYSFTAAADGYPAPTVQWQVSTDGGTSFTNISSATDTTYTANAALADNGNEYRAVFTNASGSANSDPATLTVAVAPDPPTIGTATPGPSKATVTFTPPANNGRSSIIDYTATCTSSDGGTSGTSTAAASPINVTGLDAGKTYTCQVTARNIAGSSGPSAASNSFVPTAPPSITGQPSDTTIQHGQPYSFTASASGIPAPTVQWQVSTDGGVTFTNVSGATSNTLAGTAALADSGDQFQAVYTNVAGTATTNAATLTVTAIPPQITTQPTDTSAVTGNPYSFTAGASGTPNPTVQWQKSTNGGSTFTNVSGATANTLSATASLADNGAQFRAVYTNSGGSATTNAATLTVHGIAPTVTSQPGGMAVDAGQNYLFNSGASGTPGPSVQWQVSTNGGTSYTNLAGATSTTLSGTSSLADNGKVFRAVFTNSEGSATTNAATLTVRPPAVISIGSESLLEGDSGGNRIASIAVVLSKPSVQGISVHYATANGTATAPSDYVARSGTLAFSPGVTVKYISVPIKPDTTVESNETFQVALSANTGGSSISTTHGSGTVTILNDDATSGMRVGISDASICEGNSGKPIVAHLLVSLSAPATSTVTMKLAVTGGTATAGSDYKAFAAKTVTFKTNQVQQTITVTIYPDTVPENDETILFTLSNPSSGLTIQRSVGTLTIFNDD
jgi:hypothetical protein